MIFHVNSLLAEDLPEIFNLIHSEKECCFLFVFSKLKTTDVPVTICLTLTLYSIGYFLDHDIIFYF